MELTRFHYLRSNGIPVSYTHLYLHKRDLQGNILSYRRRKTGRALTVSLTPEAMQMVRIIANKDSPYLFPILQSEEGSEAAYREYQSALRAFNQRLAVLRQCLGCLLYTSLSTSRYSTSGVTMAATGRTTMNGPHSM